MNFFEDIKIEIQMLNAKIDELISRVEKIEELQKSNSSINPKIFEIICEKKRALEAFSS